MAHNIKSVFPKRGTRKFLLVLALAITVHLGYNGQANRTRQICEPFGDSELEPKPRTEHPTLDDPEAKTFLTGATLNPAFLPDGVVAPVDLKPEQPLEDLSEPEPKSEEDGGFTVMVNGEPINVNEFEAANAQIMAAKNEALEEMTQLSIAGRRLLHKKHHDKDEEHDKKKAKHHEEYGDDDDDDDHHHHHEKKFEAETREEQNGPGLYHNHRPMTEKEQRHLCLEARNHETLWFWGMEFCWALVVLYGYRNRKQMRKRLRIKGSGFKDYLSWAFCTPCAVCQETRTITKNNVVNGVWHNPTVLITPQQAPSDQYMMAAEPVKPEKV